MRHAADSEMGAVRAAMQLGEYQRALAFCAHVAGEHLDSPGAAVLFAWLLRLGGRREAADEVIRELRARAPGDPVADAGARALAAPLPIATGVLLDLPHRVAPFPIAVGEPPPADARIVSSCVLLPGGRHVLLPTTTSQSRVWVRDGLGATREAVFDDPGDGVVTRWRLKTPNFGATETVLGPEAVAGARVFAVEYAESVSATPAWPWLRTGFLGASTRAGDAFVLGVDIVGARCGGPVLDRAGRIVGIVVRGADDRLTMRPTSKMSQPFGNGVDSGRPRSGTSPSSADRGFDAIYESALRSTLQVIVAP